MVFGSARLRRNCCLRSLFDSRPGLLQAIHAAAPVVVIDIPDAEWIEVVCDVWREVLFDPNARLSNLALEGIRGLPDAAYLVTREFDTKNKQRCEYEVPQAPSHACHSSGISHSAARIS